MLAVDHVECADVDHVEFCQAAMMWLLDNCHMAKRFQLQRWQFSHMCFCACLTPALAVILALLACRHG